MGWGLAADLSASPWLHCCEIISQHFVWRTQCQASHDITVGLSLVSGQLLASILKRKHSQMRVKPKGVNRKFNCPGKWNNYNASRNSIHRFISEGFPWVVIYPVFNSLESTLCKDSNVGKRYLQFSCLPHYIWRYILMALEHDIFNSLLHQFSSARFVFEVIITLI